MRTSPLIAAGAATVLSFGLLGATTATRATEAVGIISGTIRDGRGTPIADAAITVDGLPRLARSVDDGRFVLDSVPTGPQQLLVTKEGYRPARASLNILADSALVLDITLVADGTLLETRRIVERLRNRLVGFVVDSDDTPVPNVRVDVIGAGRHQLTDSLGRFDFGEVTPGAYVVEVRSEGYATSRHSLRMVVDVERSLTLRLSAGENTPLDIHNARVATVEGMSRMTARARAKTIVLTREDLVHYGRIGLDVALLSSPARTLMYGAPLDQMCVLVDGIRPLSRGVASMAEMSAGTGTSMPGSGAAAATPPPSESMLRTFYADQAEMVEVYPPGTDHSGTLCSRFTWGSGCACGDARENPWTIVVWQR